MKPNDKAIEAALNTFHIVSRKVITDVLEAAYAAQFQGTDYADLVARLRKTSGMYQGHAEIATWTINPDGPEAADAIEALLAERDAYPHRLQLSYRSNQEGEMSDDVGFVCPHCTTKIKYTAGMTFGEVMSLRHDKEHLSHKITCLRADLAAVTKERDALAARLAPVDDEELVEIAANAIRRNKFERTGRLDCFDPSNLTPEELGEGRAAISAIRPHIEAAERKRCAKIAEGFLSNRDWVPGSLWGNIRNEIAAAIRSER